MVLFLTILPLPSHALTPDQVFDKVKDSIVVVKTLDAKGKVKVQGSGVLLPSGKIATNCHVVKGGFSYQVGRGKQLVRTALYAEDEDKDICLLYAKGITGKPAELGISASLKVGKPVYAVGAPRGLELSLSNGIVAQLRGGPPPLIQTTAAISPGSSGGGLFDGEGRLVGLTTLYIEGGQSLNFAIPVEWIGEIKPGRKSTAAGRSQTEWLKHAMVLEQRKDWKSLLDWCREWTRSSPKDPVAWNSLGVAYSRLKRYDDAIKAFHQALEIDLDNVAAWTNLANAYSSLNMHDTAIGTYRHALRIDPEDAASWANLGVAYCEINRYDDAIEAYRQALRVNPKDAVVWYNLGNTYSEINRYTDAIEAYRQALRINPAEAIAWGNLGIAYGKLNRYTDAIEAYRQVLRINPEDAVAWYNLGIAYGRLDRYDDAIDAYCHALRINPEYANAWNNLGIAYYLSGNRTAALNAVRELRRLDPEKAEKLFDLIVPR